MRKYTSALIVVVITLGIFIASLNYKSFKPRSDEGGIIMVGFPLPVFESTTIYRSAYSYSVKDRFDTRDIPLFDLSISTVYYGSAVLNFLCFLNIGIVIVYPQAQKRLLELIKSGFFELRKR